LSWDVSIAVVEHDNIGCGEDDTEAARASGEQEDKLLAPGFVTLVDSVDPIFMRGPTVNTAVLYVDHHQLTSEEKKNDEQEGKEGEFNVLPQKTVVFQYIQDPTHLAEYEDARSLCFHRREEFVEDYHLA